MILMVDSPGPLDSELEAGIRRSGRTRIADYGALDLHHLRLSNVAVIDWCTLG